MLAAALIALFAVTAPIQEVIDEELVYSEECDDLVYGDYLEEEVSMEDGNVIEDEIALSDEEFIEYTDEIHEE